MQNKSDLNNTSNLFKSGSQTARMNRPLQHSRRKEGRIVMDNGPALIAFLDSGDSLRKGGGWDGCRVVSTSRPSVGYSGLKHEGDPEQPQPQRQQLACLRYAGLPNDVGRTADLDGHCRRAALLPAPISFQSFLPLRTSLTDTSRDEMTAAAQSPPNKNTWSENCKMTRCAHARARM